MKQRQSHYGVIGNGETCALISPSGSIDWLCLPRFDGTIMYSRALSPQGDYLDVSVYENGKPLHLQNSQQCYIEKTNILKTELTFYNLDVAITDFMPWLDSSSLSWERRFIFRVIEVTNRSKNSRTISVRFMSTVSIKSKKFNEITGGEIIKIKDFAVGFEISDRIENMRLSGKKTVTSSFVLAYAKNTDELKMMLRKVKNVNKYDELRRNKTFWENWVDKGKPINISNENYRNMYYRSLLILKLLTYDDTGAILAAPTTSLPAYPGKTQNWDYRFTWLRDAYFVSRAFLRAGHYEEVKKQIEFFFEIQGSDGHWHTPFYTIIGEEPIDEIVVRKYDETIRIGNAAKNQLQLDSEGSVLHTCYLYYLFTRNIFFIQKYWEKIKKAATWITENYTKDESGIWEFRDRKGHWTYGKVMCYTGLVSAIKLGQLFREKIPAKWENVAKKMKKCIVLNAWSNQRHSFLQTYDNDSPVDISVLALEDYGLVKPSDKKMRSTVKLIEDKLVMETGAVRRFENAHLPFYLPTLWLASHYIRIGRKDMARKLIDLCIDGSTDLSLCAEHFDPIQGRQYGNFPQTFSSSTFIERILDLTEKKVDIIGFLDVLNKGIKETIQIFEFSKEKLLEE